tara:strand:+ start:329 stop:1066 length:738 start_codon:yes stop_codon:yes gene_type:complete
MKAAIYVRVSTEEQEKKGASIAEQERRCRQWAEMKGHEVVAIYQDTKSGFTTDREGFQELMSNPEWEIVVAYKMDRFHRNILNALDWSNGLSEEGKHFAAIDLDIDTSSPMGMAIYRIMAVLGQLERDQTAERTRMGLAGVRNDGRWLGQPPYGYSIDEEHEQNGILVVNEDEAWVVRDIFALYDAGNKIGAICENLIVGGRTTRAGKRMWQYATVKRIIDRRALYMGELYKGLHATPILVHEEE